MPTNNRLRLEYALLAIFFLAGICVLFKIPYAPIIALLIGGLLSCLYFYAAFWLYAPSGMPLASRIVAGLCYSVVIIACMFLFFHWAFGSWYGIVGLAGLVLMTIICLINFKKPGYRAQLYRCIFFFAVVIALYCVRYHHAAPMPFNK